MKANAGTSAWAVYHTSSWNADRSRRDGLYNPKSVNTKRSVQFQGLSALFLAVCPSKHFQCSPYMYSVTPTYLILYIWSLKLIKCKTRIASPIEAFYIAPQHWLTHSKLAVPAAALLKSINIVIPCSGFPTHTLVPLKYQWIHLWPNSYTTMGH